MLNNMQRSCIVTFCAEAASNERDELLEELSGRFFARMRTRMTLLMFIGVLLVTWRLHIRSAMASSALTWSGLLDSYLLLVVEQGAIYMVNLFVVGTAVSSCADLSLHRRARRSCK